MSRYAIVDPDTGEVENVVVWDGSTPFPPADDPDRLVEVPEGKPAEPGGRFRKGGKPEWVPSPRPDES